jgi:hypothetical protein
MIMEQFVEWRLAGETEVLGENLPQRHFVHHKSHMTRPGLEPRTAAMGSQRLTAWAMARPVTSRFSEIWNVSELCYLCILLTSFNIEICYKSANKGKTALFY